MSGINNRLPHNFYQMDIRREAGLALTPRTKLQQYFSVGERDWKPQNIIDLQDSEPSSNNEVLKELRYMSPENNLIDRQTHSKNICVQKPITTSKLSEEDGGTLVKENRSLDNRANDMGLIRAAPQSTALSEVERAVVRNILDRQDIPDFALTIAQVDNWIDDPDLDPISTGKRKTLAEFDPPLNGCAFWDTDGKSYAFIDTSNLGWQAEHFGIPEDILISLITVQEVGHKQVDDLYRHTCSDGANEILGNLCSLERAKLTGNQQAIDWLANTEILLRLHDQASITPSDAMSQALVQNAQQETLNTYLSGATENDLTEFDEGMKRYLYSSGEPINANHYGEAIDNYAQQYLDQKGITNITGAQFMSEMRNNINTDMTNEARRIAQILKAGGSV